MNSEEKQIVLSHTQHVARHFLALKCSGDKMVELIRHSIGIAAPPPEVISQFLRREETQKTLERDHETALWISCDYAKTWRLVTLATPSTPEDASHRLNKKPPTADSCYWCWQREPGHTTELQPELCFGERVPGVLLHRACKRPWAIMRRMMERVT